MFSNNINSRTIHVNGKKKSCKNISMNYLISTDVQNPEYKKYNIWNNSINPVNSNFCENDRILYNASGLIIWKL
jgi:hypothetical protein